MKFIKLFLVTLSLGCGNLAYSASSGGHDYHAALFLGATATHGKTYRTVGADIEKSLTDMFGAGLIIDSLAESHGQTIVAVGLFYHPVEHTKVILGVGSEFSHGTSETVYRLGAGYDWHLDNGISIGPVVNVDQVHGNSAIVYGLATGYGF